MNVCESLINSARLFPEHEALVFEEHRWTYAETESLSSRAAGVLRQQGIRRGDRVGLVLPNVPAFVVWYYAVVRLGAVPVSISTRLAVEEVSFILSDCQSEILIVEEADADDLRVGVPGQRRMLVVSELADRYDDKRLADAPEMPASTWVATEPHEPAAILYTSGTTGFPKGATLSHQNVRANIHAFNHLCGMEHEDRLLLAVPLFHCYGQNALLNSGFHIGATLILQRRFDLDQSKRLIAEERVTKLFGVPTTFHLLIEYCEPSDLASVGYCFSAAATLPIQLSRHWQDKFGMPIHEGYGLTETAPFASYNHHLRHVPGSIGTPVDLVEMKIVDPDTKQDCPPEKLGEIAIRGPNVMLGYWNRPEETAAAVRDGWFYSGDLGRMDERGYFYIVDRVKDMISVGGTKVFPAEVERVLLNHSAISEAAVVGMPDEVFGEKVVAFLVPLVATLDAGELQHYCHRHLATFKVPRHFELVEELPRNPTGKVLKTELRQRQLSLRPTGGASAASEAAAPPDVGDWTVANTGQSPKTSLTAVPSRPSSLLERLRDVHPAGRQRAIVSCIQEELKDLIGSNEPLDPEERLLDAGLDSLLIVGLRDRLQQQVGDRLELPATLVFDHPRICDLASMLSDALALPGESASAHTDTNEPATRRSGHLATPRDEPVDLQKRVELDCREPQDDIESMSEQQALQELLRELDE